jgi:hypothetical protein
MISVKAVVALAVSGLGAASMASVAYLEFGKRAPIAAPVPEPATPAARAVVPKAEAPPPAPQATPITLEPVFIYGRMARHVAKPEKTTQLVACSDWRALESGPSGHGVRTLCTQ